MLVLGSARALVVIKFILFLVIFYILCLKINIQYRNRSLYSILYSIQLHDKETVHKIIKK